MSDSKGAKPVRYGDFMLPLDLAKLDLPADMRIDPDVIRYVSLHDQTLRAEKVSDPNNWTSDQSEAYDRGDWKSFSRLRGYTEEEISQFEDYLAMSYALIAKYGEDDVGWIGYTIHEQTGILGLTPQQILKMNRQEKEGK